MSSELELIAKDLEPIVGELVEASGALQPVRELTAIIADSIRYRWRVPHAIRLIERAAEQARQSGLPPRAIPDKLIAAVIEEGLLEDDESMQERWSNLLAHQARIEDVPPSIPEILKQLEPPEARALDRLSVERGYLELPALELLPEQAGNLERLGLIREDTVRHGSDLPGFLGRRFPPLFQITPLGQKLVACCEAIV